MPSVAQAAAEVLKRRKAALDIYSYADLIDIAGQHMDDDAEDAPIELERTTLAEHHKLILRECVGAAERHEGRLMILMPPGSAKSTYASVVFPSYYLGKHDRSNVIVASYGDELARKFGRRTRNLIKQNRYQQVMNTRLVTNSAAESNFVLSNESEYMACGILSGVTGNRADLIIIDDPIKGREQADSPAIREKTYNAYKDDLLTRVKPGASIILIQTRWHEDDLAGRILPVGWKGESGDFVSPQDGKTWRVLCIQAECRNDSDPLQRKQGEYLWVDWFPESHWEQFKLSPRTWASLFQQIPSPLAGQLFRPDMIRTLDALPAGRILWVRGWDLAASEDIKADYTAGPKIGLHEDGRIIMADLVHGQWATHDRDTQIRSAAERDGRGVTQDMPQDPGSAGKSQIVSFAKLLRGFKMVFSTESGSKETRAEPVSTQINVGNFYMLRADWNAKVINELRPFPSGLHDDIVDGISRAFSRLNEKKAPMRVKKSALTRAKAKGRL